MRTSSRVSTSYISYCIKTRGIFSKSGQQEEGERTRAPTRALDGSENFFVPPSGFLRHIRQVRARSRLKVDGTSRGILLRLSSRRRLEKHPWKSPSPSLSFFVSSPAVFSPTSRLIAPNNFWIPTWQSFLVSGSLAR